MTEVCCRLDSSSDEEDNELQMVESGKHDIVCLQEKVGTTAQGVMRSRKHHPMYPYHEDKVPQYKLMRYQCYRVQSNEVKES